MNARFLTQINRIGHGNDLKVPSYIQQSTPEEKAGQNDLPSTEEIRLLSAILIHLNYQCARLDQRIETNSYDALQKRTL
jgi:hypothetical protein